MSNLETPLSNSELVQPLINIIFPFVLLITLYLVYRFIQSLWQKPVESSFDNYFRKGKTQYLDPPRPNSPKFNKLFRLSHLSTPTQQYELVDLASDMIKDIIQSKISQLNSKFSPNLELFVENPNFWLQQQYQRIKEENRLKDEKYTSEFVSTKLKQIILEIEELYDIPLIDTED